MSIVVLDLGSQAVRGGLVRITDGHPHLYLTTRRPVLPVGGLLGSVKRTLETLVKSGRPGRVDRIIVSGDTLGLKVDRIDDEILAHVMPLSGIHWVNFADAAFHAYPSAVRRGETLLVVDRGRESRVFVRRAHGAEQVASLEFGHDHIAESVAKHFALARGAADSLLTLYAQGLVLGSITRDVDDLLVRLEDEWRWHWRTLPQHDRYEEVLLAGHPSSEKIFAAYLNGLAPNTRLTSFTNDRPFSRWAGSNHLHPSDESLSMLAICATSLGQIR